MSKGFIPVKRTLFEHFLFKEHRVFSRFEAWLDLIQLASFTDGQTDMIKGKIVTRNRGEVVASIRWISGRWNWSIHKTCDFIEVLRSQEMVVVGKENGITRLSLVNFEKHNSIGKEEKNSDGNSKRNSKDQSGKGFDENQGTPDGTQKGTSGEQRGDSKGTNYKKDNNPKKEKKGEGAGAPPTPGHKEEKQKAMEERQKAFYNSLKPFVKDFSKQMIRAFYDYWSEPNKARTKMKFEMEDTWELGRRLSTWERRDSKWNRAPAGGTTAEIRATLQDLEYLYQRFLEDRLDSKVITEAHTNFLLEEQLIQLEERFITQAVSIRIKNLMGSNQAAELRMITAYQAGTWPADPDCRADAPNRERIAKKFALYALFQGGKQLKAASIEELKKLLSNGSTSV